ncbi:hypothetical protein CK203_065320 [Vitis vinifera]|uniref:Bulb-type lectin domain-containing protein n=1 Tax=Vitis vinifera TaxID=29760 RepID=A0A438G253_VITVI|nr:hypothetical protein CK203_065320 [Vitis vinifera]
MEGKMIRRKFMVPVSATHMLSAIFFLCKTFELGFFNPDGRFNNGKYIGIWYYLLKPQRVVWVANRDSPLPLSDPPFGVFAFKDDGMVMKLMDSWNLVLSDNISGEIL